MKKTTTFQLLICISGLLLTLQAYAQPRINEIHYNDSGADANERVEIAGPAGTNLAGWSIVTYNGGGGGVISDEGPLTGTLIIPNQCTVSGQNGGTLVFDVVAITGTAFPNPAMSAIALVNGSTCVEFLSYQGTLTATQGACTGVTSTDIGAFEDGTGSDLGSIQKNSNGTWTTNANTNTFGACNTSQSAFPVELIRFDAKVVQRTVQLNWQTATERNNDRFEIQRSTNGRDFITLQVVRGAGTATTEQRYEFTDQQPGRGANYYRLRQVDLDGTATYLPTVYVMFGKPANVAVFAPNPSLTGLTRLTYIAGTESTLKLTVRDLSGRTVMQQSREVGEGENQLSIDCSALTKGTYLVEMATNDDTQVQKLVIQ